jgi:hypothetical protein
MKCLRWRVLFGLIGLNAIRLLNHRSVVQKLNNLDRAIDEAQRWRRRDLLSRSATLVCHIAFALSIDIATLGLMVRARVSCSHSS